MHESFHFEHWHETFERTIVQMRWDGMRGYTRSNHGIDPGIFSTRTMTASSVTSGNIPCMAALALPSLLCIAASRGSHEMPTRSLILAEVIDKRSFPAELMTVGHQEIYCTVPYKFQKFPCPTDHYPSILLCPAVRTSQATMAEVTKRHGPLHAMPEYNRPERGLASFDH